MQSSEWLTVGKIVGVQGLQGEVRVYPDSDFPERFVEPGTRWLLRPGASQPESIELLSGRYLTGKGLYVVRFAGITDRTQAELLRDARLLVPESDRPPLEDDEFHVIDLIGLSVFDQATQARVGVVVDVLSAGNDLLEVELSADDGTAQASEESPGKASKKVPKVLIPFVKAIVPVVDLSLRRIEITPPPGLI